MLDFWTGFALAGALTLVLATPIAWGVGYWRAMMDETHVRERRRNK